MKDNIKQTREIFVLSVIIDYLNMYFNLYDREQSLFINFFIFKLTVDVCH